MIPIFLADHAAHLPKTFPFGHVNSTWGDRGNHEQTFYVVSYKGTFLAFISGISRVAEFLGYGQTKMELMVVDIECMGFHYASAHGDVTVTRIPECRNVQV